MAANQTHVKVTLKTMITTPEDRNREHIDVQAPGKFYEKNNTFVLLFNETVEDGNSVKNMVTISESKVVIKRTGHVKMNQIFQEDQMTESTYYHPFGTMRMETNTKNIHFEQTENGRKGQLNIDYLLSLNENEPQDHRLTLTYERME